MEIDGLHTLQIKGQKNGKGLTLLIHSGSSYNFVSPTTVKSLGLQTQPSSPVNVLVANGEKLISNQQVRGFHWEMMGIEFEADMLVLPIKGYDAILGIN